MPLRRLTRLEYINTIRDLTGFRVETGKLPGEPLGDSGFATPGIMSELDFTAYRAAAESVVGSNTTTTAILRSLACPAQDDACAQALIEKFGRRAFRRPVEPREKEVYLTFFQKKLRGELGYSFADGMRVLIATLLQSPAFLYRRELGSAAPLREGALVKLNPHEVASRLSYFLWSSMPDADLFAAADAGKLGSPEEIDAQVARMLKDPRTGDTIRAFAGEWLHTTEVSQVNKSDKAYPASLFHPAVASGMGQEIGLFARKILLEDGDGRLASLLTTPVTYINGELGKVYGLSITASRDTYVKAELDPTLRRGILTRLAFLAVNANAYDGDPVKRGKIVREQLLCQELAAPPGDVPPLPALKPGMTVRERHDMHATQPVCRACHVLMDPIGHAFGAFDAIGGHRPLDQGKPVDPSGQIANLDGQTKTFSDTNGLIDALAGSPEVRRCFATQWLRFALRREVGPADAETVTEVRRAFEASDGHVPKLLAAIARGKSLRYRSLAPGEAKP
jgi:hypothetical protein